MKAKKTVSEKYDRASAHYDRMESLIEATLFEKARKRAISQTNGRILEIGVGTGKNLPHYPPGTEVTAIDVSPGMLEQAKERASRRSDIHVELFTMDAQELSFADDTFDTILSTFVFCTVPDPITGLREAIRVLKPGGTAVFLEHMLSRHRLLNVPLRLMNLVTVPLLGTSMTRRTEKNIRDAGFIVQHVEYHLFDIVRLIRAQNPPPAM